MRLFIDANILVTVLNKEYPLYSNAARILSLADRSGYEIYTTPVCLAIAFYFAEKKHKRETAVAKIKLLCQHIRIAPVTDDCVQQALSNPQVTDFEDGMEYYAAKLAQCRCIITENEADFYFADIEILNCNRFLQQMRQT